MRTLALLLCALPLYGCRREPPRPDLQPAPKVERIPELTVKEGRGLLYSFFDFRAEMRTVERRDQVPETARAEVMVTDPARSLPGDSIWVADLRKPEKNGEFKVTMMTRGGWLDRVTPKLSQLRGAVASAAVKSPDRAPKPKKRRPRPRPAAKTESGGPKVILFSTAWCPSCKAARQFFQARKVHFVELDVEKDPQAGQQYQAISTSFKLRPGVVPLIIINGRPLQGFSQQQVEAALAGG